MLWPPNHKMIDISALIAVIDACDPNPTVTLQSIVSNETANSKGDGNTSPDIAGVDYGTDDRAFQLRAERKGNGSGRIYTGTYEAQDASGNVAHHGGTVTVPHSYAGVSQNSLTFDSVADGNTSPAKTVSISNTGPDPMGPCLSRSTGPIKPTFLRPTIAFLPSVPTQLARSMWSSSRAKRKPHRNIAYQRRRCKPAAASRSDRNRGSLLCQISM